MLKSSVLVQCILWIFGKLNQLYENSMIHRALALTGKSINRQFQNSSFLKAFQSIEEKMNDSRTYLILEKLSSLIVGIFRTINSFLQKVLDNSYVFQQIYCLKDVNQGFYGVSLIFLGFGIGLLLTFFTTQRRDGLFGLLFLFIGFFGLLLSRNVRGTVGSSLLGKLGYFFSDFIAMDEEVRDDEV